MAIEFYKEFGDLGYLASYADYGFYEDDVFYKTVEHYYQSHKFDDPEIRRMIIESDTPREASNIGRRRDLKRIDNFRNIKDRVMFEGTLEKFLQNSKIRSKLIETRNNEIKEMTEKESYWGVGPNLDGENHMGKILMAVREEVKLRLLKDIIENCKGKKVYVVGHHNPDADSIFSSVILTHILRSYGIDAVMALRDEKIVDEDLIKDYLDEEYVVLDNYDDKDFILVDHNSLDGISKDRVIGCFDHHIITGEVDNLIEAEYASTGLLLYDLFKDYYKFSDKEKVLIGLSVLADTEYLVSSRFSEEDKELYNELDFNIDVGELQKKYFKTNNFNESIFDNFHRDYKEYNIDGMNIRRSIISSYSDDLDEYHDSYIYQVKDYGIDLLIWCDYESKTTYVYYNGEEFEFPFFTTSTYLVLKELKKTKRL